MLVRWYTLWYGPVRWYTLDREPIRPKQNSLYLFARFVLEFSYVMQPPFGGITS